MTSDLISEYLTMLFDLTDITTKQKCSLNLNTPSPNYF